MTLPDDIERWFKKPPVYLIIGVLAFFGAVVGIWKSYPDWKSFVTTIVQAGIEIDWQNRNLSAKTWFFVLLAVLPILAGIFLVLFIRAVLRLRKAQADLQRPESELRKELNAKDERARVAHKTLLGMMLAAHRIRIHLFPTPAQQVHSFVSIKNTYLIDKDFNGEVTREYEIKASGTPVHFWELWITVEQNADPMEFLDDIQFKATDETGYTLSYLQTMNEPRVKKVAVFFLPRIAPDETKPRRVVVTYKWHGMFKRLRDLEHEPYTWIVESSEPVQSAEFSVFREPGAGTNLDCKVAGSTAGQQSLAAATSAGSKWPGWQYLIKGAPADEYTLDLRLKKP